LETNTQARLTVTIHSGSQSMNKETYLQPFSAVNGYLSLGVTQLAQGEYFLAIQSTQRALPIILIQSQLSGYVT